MLKICNRWPGSQAQRTAILAATPNAVVRAPRAVPGIWNIIEYCAEAHPRLKAEWQRLDRCQFGICIFIFFILLHVSAGLPGTRI